MRTVNKLGEHRAVVEHKLGFVAALTLRVRANYDRWAVAPILAVLGYRLLSDVYDFTL